MQSMHQLACPKRPSDRIPVTKLCSLVTGNTQLCALQNPRHSDGIDIPGSVVQANPPHDNGLQEQPEIREWGGIPYMPHLVNYQ